MTGFQVEFDPSTYPKLLSRGDNYTEWKAIWKIAFKYTEVWQIISGKTPRPITLGEAQDEWDAADTKAMVLLIGSVHSDLTSMITNYEKSPAAWKYLADRFDRDTGNISIYLFRALTNLRYKDGDDLRVHLDKFHEMWIRMTKRCQSSQQNAAKVMRQVFESDEVKGSFFLTTLPDTMDHIIDNISTRGITTYTDIEPKMLDIAENKVVAANGSAITPKKPRAKEAAKAPAKKKRRTTDAATDGDTIDEGN